MAPDAADNHGHHAVEQPIETHCRRHVGVERDQDARHRDECRTDGERLENDGVGMNASSIVAQLRVTRHRQRVDKEPGSLYVFENIVAK